MNQPNDDELDIILRDSFDGPVPDDGFCAGVMERLPARHRYRGWPVLAGTLTGVVACAISLWLSPVANTGWLDWLSGDLSASALALIAAVTGMAALALAWALAEAGDREAMMTG